MTTQVERLAAGAGEVEFRPMRFPATMQDLDGADKSSAVAEFRTMVEVRNEIYRAINGHDDETVTAAELLPHYQPRSYEDRLMWLILHEGTAVGRCAIDLPLEGEATYARGNVELLPRMWGRGIGTTALELLEGVARERGYAVLQGWAAHPEAPGPRLEAPTGFGLVPQQDHAARFLARHGFTLEQIERYSVLDLEADPARLTAHLQDLRAHAAAHARDYRLVSWTAPVPPEHRDGYALLKSRMSTDAPSAEMEIVAEEWDQARVAAYEAEYLDVDRTLHVVAAQHIETGTLAALNELATRQGAGSVTDQEDTLVLREHRGHRLGMLVKCENLLRWPGVAPHSPRVVTYNAEENRPMLSINEAIGFTARSFTGAWRKKL